MSLWQKIEFIGWPLVWGLISLCWFILGLLTLILSVLFLTLSVIHRVNGTDVRDPLAGLIIVALSSVGLWITVPKLVEAVRRKKRTGSFFQRREELLAWKAEGQRRKIRKKIDAVVFFAWLSVGPTIGVIYTVYRHSPLMWAIAALMWTATILVAVASFPLRPEPRWLPPAMAAVLGFAALISAELATSSQEPRGFWGFAVLMLTLSVVSVVYVFRSNRRKSRPLPQST